MHVRDYAHAAYQVINSGHGVDETLTKLKSVMQTRGSARLYPRVLKELVALLEKHVHRTVTTVTVARVKDISRHDLDIEKALMSLEAAKEYTTVVDPTIVGGFKISKYDRVIDSTYKRRLVTLYRSIIG
jgi:F0F1-type ATP synthase delta subunit